MAKLGQHPNSQHSHPFGLRVVGVLGGVGSGKSTVAALLAEQLPGVHLDADQIVTELLKSVEIGEQISVALGPGLLGPDGLVCRKSIGERIFQDSKARSNLESILHPAVRKELWEGLQIAEACESGWAVLDAPLLLENGLNVICDHLIFTETEEKTRASRAMARHGWSLEEWQLRESAQLSIEQKKSSSHAILYNVSGVEHLCKQVQELLPTLRALPPRPLRDRWPSPDRSPF